MADVIGSNSTAALTFRDQKAATDTLTALSQEPHVLYAETFDADKTAFAHYVRSDPSQQGSPPPAIAIVPSVESTTTRETYAAKDYLELASPSTWTDRSSGGFSFDRTSPKWTDG